MKSLASQQGEAEADMALSKWFLCGAEGAFEKDENLAYVFAEKVTCFMHSFFLRTFIHILLGGSERSTKRRVRNGLLR